MCTDVFPATVNREAPFLCYSLRYALFSLRLCSRCFRRLVNSTWRSHPPFGSPKSKSPAIAIMHMHGRGRSPSLATSTSSRPSAKSGLAYSLLSSANPSMRNQGRRPVVPVTRLSLCTAFWTRLLVWAGFPKAGLFCALPAFMETETWGL